MKCPRRLTGLNTWPLLVALFVKVMAVFGGRALLKEVHHWGWRFYSLTPLPIPCLLPVHRWNVISLLPDRQAGLMFLISHIPNHHGPYPLREDRKQCQANRDLWRVSLAWKDSLPLLLAPRGISLSFIFPLSLLQLKFCKRSWVSQHSSLVSLPRWDLAPPMVASLLAWAPFCGCNKSPWPRQFIEERFVLAYGSRGIESLLVNSLQQALGRAAGARSWAITSFKLSRESTGTKVRLYMFKFYLQWL